MEGAPILEKSLQEEAPLKAHMMRASQEVVLVLVVFLAIGCEPSTPGHQSGGPKVQSEEELLFDAVRADDPDEIKILVDGGIDVFRAYRDEGTLGARALVIAGTSGAPQAARALLEAGVSPSATFGGKSGLDQAASQGNMEVVGLLLEAGVDLGTEQAAWAGEYAASDGRLDILRLLVEHGLDVNAQPDLEVGPPLLSAAYGGHLEVVRYLLEQGADPNQRTEVRRKDGTIDTLTPRAVALNRGHKAVVALLDRHALPDRAD